VTIGIDELRRMHRLQKMFGLDRLVASAELSWWYRWRLKAINFLRPDEVHPYHRPLFIGLILIGGGLYLVLTFIMHV